MVFIPHHVQILIFLQTHFILETRSCFRLISYWTRLLLANLTKEVYAVKMNAGRIADKISGVAVGPPSVPRVDQLDQPNFGPYSSKLVTIKL